MMAQPVGDDGLTLTRSDNAAGFKWVTPTSSGKFQAKPTLEKGGPQVDLGSFDSAEEAALACARAIRDFEAGTYQAKEKLPRKPRTSKKRQLCVRARLACLARA